MLPIRILVVEDSLTVRRHLCHVIAQDPGLEVVGEAEDGQRAIELCEELRPDVITMDMMLPRLTGLEATEHIMAHRPTPILVVSASMNRGEVFRTYEALARGAVDVLEKPTGEEPEGDWEARFHEAIKLVARVHVITHLRGRLRATSGQGSFGSRDAAHRIDPGATASVTRLLRPPPPGPSSHADPSSHFGASARANGGPSPSLAGRVIPHPSLASSLGSPLASSLTTPREPRLVAIGASTGGPGAILQILRGIPAPFPLPILVVLHLAEAFSASFAEWLNAQTDHPVSYARHGQRVDSLAGQVVLAPATQHIAVRAGVLRLESSAPRFGCRPSVDVLFESLATEYGNASVACLLTGMGRDGASGLLAIRQAGGTTLGQDEASCVVYGMPREAALLGAVTRVLPLADFARTIEALATPRRGRS